MKILSLAVSFLASLSCLAGTGDELFLQDVAVRIASSPELREAKYQKLAITPDGIVYLLTSEGVARVYDNRLALDRSFRPLARKKPKDICLSGGILYYLYEDRWLSNDGAGKPQGLLPSSDFEQIAADTGGAAEGAVVTLNKTDGLLYGPTGRRNIGRPGQSNGVPCRLYSDGHRFLALNDNTLFSFDGSWKSIHQGTNLTCLAFRGDEILIGTGNGFYGIDGVTGKAKTPLQTRLPATSIACIRPAPDGLWIGATRGVFFQRTSASKSPALPDGPNGIRYYASKRWLLDDDVVDLALDPEGHLWVLTQTGLNKIEFRATTLAAKADYFDRKVRSRHIRFGFSAERRMTVPGDIASGEMIDTDNDGGWSSYYLASQAFRFAVTGDDKARQNAWETFAALERLQTINPLDGFPARTFERKGFKYSDTDRWADSPEQGWEWKHTTSSDEIASHTFAYAVLYECAAQNEAEKQRIASCFDRIMGHIVRNNLYLIDIDGKPTLWGRWNPEYLNWFPHTIFDRRLNSSEIIASLQLAYKMTGKAIYREKALELLEKHGYLENIAASMRNLRPTKGYVHQGIELGDEWNHSDDELAFVTYWVLYRFALNDDLKSRFGAAIKDHWDMEKAEQSPFWNFIYAGCGGADCDAAGAVWTLRGFPLDTICWRVENSQRKDLTRLPDSFRKQELEELLPPGERQSVRCNTQPFILDGGDNGHTELAGDEYLLGYWLGRYMNQIVQINH
jgi:hypothetical protein